MVRNNLGLGVVLAIVVLWLFLRRFRATLLVAVAIPVSLFAAFLGLDFAGRTVNIISLAGLAFAVGMTLDAAIVVLENIVRLRERGMAADEAALMGPEQVWGALLASTATTVAIFLPIVFLEDEAGQLFADLALTIAMAVVASMAGGAHRHSRRVVEVALPRAARGPARGMAPERHLRDRAAHRRAGEAGVLDRDPDRDPARDLARAGAEGRSWGSFRCRSGSPPCFRNLRWRCARATCPRATGTSCSRSSSRRRG